MLLHVLVLIKVNTFKHTFMQLSRPKLLAEICMRLTSVVIMLYYSYAQLTLYNQKVEKSILKNCVVQITLVFKYWELKTTD